jgi:hypothetical protein
MGHGKTKTRFRTVITTTATMKINIFYIVTARTTTPQKSCDRDHDDSNTSDRECVSCRSYHLRAVVVTM